MGDSRREELLGMHPDPVALGCDLMQGNYFSVAVDADEVTRFVRQPRRHDLPGRPNRSNT